MATKVSVTNIEWDNEVDGVLEDVSRLPTEEPELWLDVYMEDGWTSEEIDDAVADEIADYLSNEYGYLVRGFEWDYL